LNLKADALANAQRVMGAALVVVDGSLTISVQSEAVAGLFDILAPILLAPKGILTALKRAVIFLPMIWLVSSHQQ
jgi:hypothetical protein